MMAGPLSIDSSPESRGLALERPCAPRAARIKPITPHMSVDATHGDFEHTLKPLWLRAQDGDEIAYRQCLSLLSGRLRAYLRRRLAAQPDEVEDLVQETLLALHLQRVNGIPIFPIRGRSNFPTRLRIGLVGTNEPGLEFFLEAV